MVVQGPGHGEGSVPASRKASRSLAALAAAMSLREGIAPRKLPVSDLREALRKDGAVI